MLSVALLLAAHLLAQAPDAGAPPVVVPPAVLEAAEAAFPEEARAAGLSGVVGLEVDLSETGAVTDARVVEPAGNGFDASALEAIRRYRFSPATVDGVPTPVRIRFDYRFDWTAPPPAEAPAETADGGSPPAPARPAALFAGRVVQRGTRTPLAGAEVVLPEAGLSTVTGPDGRFELPEVPEGEQPVVVVAQGHERFETREPFRAGERVEATYYVRRLPGSGYETTVRDVRERKEVTRTTLQVTEVQRIPGSQGDSLKVVQNLPGVARPAFNGGAIAIRGTTPQQSGIYLDGIRIPVLFHFVGLTSVYNSDLLESLDYLPGNFPATYGNALGGVVDVKSRPGRKDRWGGTASVSLLEASGLVEGPVGDAVTVAVAGRRSYVDALLSLAPATGPAQLSVAPRYYDAQARVEWRATPRNSFSLLALTSDDVSETAIDRPSSADPSFAGTFLVRTRFDQVRLRHRFTGDRWRSDTQFMLGRGGTTLKVGNAFGIDIQFVEQTLRHTSEYAVADWLTLAGGIDVNNQQATVVADLREGGGNREGEPNIPGAALERVQATAKDFIQYYPATWVEARWKPLPGLLVVPGIRSESYIYTEQARPRRDFSPRIAARWALNDAWTLKAGTGLYHAFPAQGDPTSRFGNPELLGARSHQSSVGAEWRPSPVWFLSAEAFYNRLSRLTVSSSRTVERGGEQVPERLNNDGIGRVQGVELFVRRQLADRFFGWLSYTLSRSERIDRPGEQWRPFDNDQTHILTLIASYQLPAGFELGARFRYATGNPLTPVLGARRDDLSDVYIPFYGAVNSGRLPPFNQLDVRLDKTFTFEQWTLEAFLEVLNAYNNPSVEGVTYSYDYRQRAYFTGIPLIPNLGVKGRF